MPSRLAISSAERPEPRRNAFRRLPMSSKRMAIALPNAPTLRPRPPCPAAQPLRRVERGGDDALVSRAPAQVARNRHPHLLLGRIGIVAQELSQRDQHSRRAETALQAVIVAERFLERAQFGGTGRETLNP